MAVEVRKSMPKEPHHSPKASSQPSPGSIQWSIRRATIWLWCYSPGNCLFPWCRCKPVYIGALRNPQNATWSSNHVGLELFAEVSTYPSWSRIFSRATARHLESWWRPFWVTLWCDVVHGQETPKYTYTKIFPLQISNLLANRAILSDVSSQSKVSLLGASNDLSEKEGLSSITAIHDVLKLPSWGIWVQFLRVSIQHRPKGLPCLGHGWQCMALKRHLDIILNVCIKVQCVCVFGYILHMLTTI